MLQIVAANEDGGASLGMIFGQEVFQDVLARWIEIVKRFVEYHQFWSCEQYGDDANFLFVARAEIANVFFLTENLTVCKRQEASNGTALDVRPVDGWRAVG